MKVFEFDSEEVEVDDEGNESSSDMDELRRSGFDGWEPYAVTIERRVSVEWDETLARDSVDRKIVRVYHMKRERQ